MDNDVPLAGSNQAGTQLDHGVLFANVQPPANEESGMMHSQPNAFEGELNRRLAILARGEDVDRRLLMADKCTLAAITIGSFMIVLIAQLL